MVKYGCCFHVLLFSNIVVLKYCCFQILLFSSIDVLKYCCQLLQLDIFHLVNSFVTFCLFLGKGWGLKIGDDDNDGDDDDDDGDDDDSGEEN